MTIGWQQFFGGESRDTLVDGTLGGTTFGAGWSIITSPVKTGSAAWQVAVDGSHMTAGPVLIAALQTTLLAAHVAWCRLSALPSAAFALAGLAQDSALALECNTDGTLRLVKLGTGGSQWSGRTALTGWSSVALSTTAYKHLALFFDPLTLGSSHVWAALQIDEVEQWAVDIGAYPVTDQAWRTTPNIGSVNGGCNVYWDDFAGLASVTGGDAPHLTNWPKPKVTRQLATSDDKTDFTNGSGGTGSYTEWDETTGNDGDTTYNVRSSSDPSVPKIQSSGGQSSATIGISGETVLHKFAEATAGPTMPLVHRYSTGTKFGGYTYSSTDTTGIVVAAPATSYGGRAPQLYKSGGWVASDADALKFGVQLPTGASHNQDWRVTLCMMMWCTYATTLPKTTTPSLPGAGISQVIVL